MHLAQLNIGRPRYQLEHPRMGGFVGNLDRVNAIAERSPGFVWRLVGEDDNATDIRFEDDPDLIVNMSVWESAEHLEHFVWNTIHKRFYERRSSWFGNLGKPHFVMWHVPVGHIPTLAEARERLNDLVENGPSDRAFGWEGLPNLKRWMEARCA